MGLNLKKPLVVFDLETTGTNVASDRIVEISIVKVHPDGKRDIKTRRVNPEMPIPAVVSEIHGIYDADVAEEPTFKQLAKGMFKFIHDCDLSGFNCLKFDIPVIVEEFLRAGINFDPAAVNIVDVQNIFHKQEPRTLVAALKFYCNKELENAHSAEADTLATLDVLEAQLEKYDDLENDMEWLSEYSRYFKFVDLAGRMKFNEDDKEVFNFGKYKGQLVEEVLKKDKGYYGWIQQGQFTLHTKQVLREIKERVGA